MKNIAHRPFGLVVALGLAACASTDDLRALDETPGDETVVQAMGHGRFLGTGYDVLEPSPALFERTQRALVARLTREAAARGIDGDVDAVRTRLAQTQSDPFLAEADLIDWLIETAAPGDHATLASVNGAMRAAHRGPDADVSARVTFNSGQKYIDECRAAGVPIPPPMFKTEPDGNWVEQGILDVNFLGGEAHLYKYQASNGFCLALPRLSGGVATALGIICFGTTPTGGTNKACFWDNPSGMLFPDGVEVPLTSFVGGYDLEYNGGGVCSDCHAGANPFVVHPNDPAFRNVAYADMGATNWYEPIVHSNWPQNRGPSNLLAGVPSTQRCDQSGCHASVMDGGRAGQFPIVSSELPRYCDTVLANAAGIFGGPARTMPPSSEYDAHRRALRDACGSLPDTGKVGLAPSVPVNPQYVSPPTLQTVAYDCAQKVEVNNVALGATVTLTVNSTSYVQITKNVSHIEFGLSAPLAIGDRISVFQTINGVPSSTTTLTVRDHRLDYPAGLPAPAINPDLVYACADVIAVAHVPGATVTVSSSLGAPVTSATSSGWTSFWPGARPFVVGDTFSATQRMCPGEPASPPSATVRAVTAPTSLPAPTFDPPRAFDGQQLVSIGSLVNGSRTRFMVGSSYAGTLDAPISWWTNFNLASALGRALRNGETVSGQPSLCSTGAVTTIPVSKCSELPAPRIETPLLPGATAVVVSIAQPGARIRVFDAAGNELGNSGGTVINLRRALVVGDEVRVVQEVGACRSTTAHYVYVRAPGQ